MLCVVYALCVLYTTNDDDDDQKVGLFGVGGGSCCIWLRVVHVAFSVSTEDYTTLVYVYVFLKYCALLSSTYLAAKMLTSNAKIFTIYNNVRRV